MNIVVIASGSRGDVQPFVALGKGLQAAGHTVSVFTTLDFQDLVTSYGLAFASMGVSVEATAQSMQVLVEQGNMLKVLSMQAKASERLARYAAINGMAACQDADLLIGGLGGLFTGLMLSEKLGIPFLQAHVLPFTPTNAFPGLLAPFPSTPLLAWANRTTHQITRQMIWQSSRSADAKARAQLGLPAPSFWGAFATLDRSTQPILYGYSPQVLPPPADWGPSIHVTGYWLLPPPEGWQPPADLVAFLEAGPPPVYVGFGSMGSTKPEATAEMVIQALARTGQRGVLSSGWGGLKQDQLPSNVFMVGSVPHSWLFPRMAAVVHHGGAGTTAAGLSAGVPSIITPFFADQPFWGRRVYELGVGPKPIPRRALQAANLAEAIGQAMHDTTMRSRAAALGERIRAEDGVARAVAIIEQHNRHA